MWFQIYICTERIWNYFSKVEHAYCYISHTHLNNILLNPLQLVVQLRAANTRSIVRNWYACRDKLLYAVDTLQRYLSLVADIVKDVWKTVSKRINVLAAGSQLNIDLKCKNIQLYLRMLSVVTTDLVTRTFLFKAIACSC